MDIFEPLQLNLGPIAVERQRTCFIGYISWKLVDIIEPPELHYGPNCCCTLADFLHWLDFMKAGRHFWTARTAFGSIAVEHQRTCFIGYISSKLVDILEPPEFHNGSDWCCTARTALWAKLWFAVWKGAHYPTGWVPNSLFLLAGTPTPCANLNANFELRTHFAGCMFYPPKRQLHRKKISTKNRS